LLRHGTATVGGDASCRDAVKGSWVVWTTSDFPNPRGVIEGSGPNEWHFIIDANATDLCAAAEALCELEANPAVPK
jgi:hypothetical protein